MTAMVDLLSEYHISFGPRPLVFPLIAKKHFLPTIAGKFSPKLEIPIFRLSGQIICRNRGFRGHLTT